MEKFHGHSNKSKNFQSVIKKLLKILNILMKEHLIKMDFSQAKEYWSAQKENMLGIFKEVWRMDKAYFNIKIS